MTPKLLRWATVITYLNSLESAKALDSDFAFDLKLKPHKEKYI
jgi:hypothetical protein